MRFHVQKYEKQLKFKNDIKKPLGPLHKKLWAILVISNSGQILKPSTLGEKWYKNIFIILRSITKAEKWLKKNTGLKYMSNPAES